jgi:alcohol dehydrogenase class IV
VRTSWNFFTAGQITFGPGSIDQLGEIARRRKLSRALIITDGTLRSLGLVERIVKPLEGANVRVDIFDGGEPEPSSTIALKAVEQAQTFKPDVLVGLGGGSNMDAAKLTAVLLTHGGRPADYFGVDRVPGPVLPLICIPTTSGTGSEVSHAAVVTDAENKIKVSTLSNYLRPAVAVVDPQLTYACPKKVTADSGIDALTHAIESYTANDYDQLPAPAGDPLAYTGRTPLGNCLAEEAIKLIGQHLVTAVQEPTNHAARDGMSLAATVAGLSFSNCGVALVHALEYPLGGALHCSHGAGNGLLLPYVMRFNLPKRQSSFARIAQLLGENIDGLSEQAAAERAISAVERIRGEIGIPARIRDIGGREDQLPTFAEKAFAIKRLMWVNPRLPTGDDLLAILRQAF